MVESKLYKQICDHIEEQEKNYALIWELEEEDLEIFPEEHRPYYRSLGTMAEFPKPEDWEEFGKFRIYIKTDHVKADNEVCVVSTLCHEYGHYVCRVYLYPKLGPVGRYLFAQLATRLDMKERSWSYMTKLITVVEELVAWVIGWGLLKKFHALTLQHVTYGLKCWKSYWRRLKFW